MSIALAVVAALSCGPAVQGPTARVRLSNPAAVRRAELVRFSMPWPRGTRWSLDRVRVGDDVAPCVTLERWDDGSIGLTQVHARVALEANAEVEWPIEPAEGSEVRPRFDPAVALPLVTELTDPWGRVFHARLEPDPAGPLVEDLSTERVVVRRYRGMHVRRAEDGAVETFLPVEAWVVELCHEQRLELTLVLDADPRSGEPVLGPTRFRQFALRVEDARWRVLPRFRGPLLLSPPTPIPDGGFVQPLLGPSDAIYLGDRTRKAFQFDVFVGSDGADDETRAAARLAVEEPIVALPDLDWVRTTRMFGSHGGPAPVVPMEAAVLAARRDLGGAALEGGPFGAFGDPRDAIAAGMQRNLPFVFGDVLRARGGGPLLSRMRLLGSQQALRPTPATLPRLPEGHVSLRAGLPSRAISHPHGYAACGYETFSVDLLHDVYWLTGDPFARHEIARIGTGLVPMLGALPFRTSRGEGAILQGGVLVARATGDRALLEWLHRRFHELVVTDIGDDSGGRAHAIAQPPSPAALGIEHPFDAPWQMAVLVHGLHALWRATGDDDVRLAAVRVAGRMARSCWIDGEGLAALVSAVDPNVRARALPERGGEGSRAVAAAAFVLAVDMAVSDDDGSLFRSRADALVGDERGGPALDDVSEPWLQLYRDRTSSDR